MYKMFTISCLMTVLAATASAGVIHDIRSDLVPLGAYVAVSDAVVTAVMDNSFIAAETELGPRHSIWVYLGEAPVIAVGDVVDFDGTYIDQNGRDCISLLYPATAAVTVVGSAAPPVNEVTVSQLLADQDGWSSTHVFVTDGLLVQDIMQNGQWLVASYETGHLMVLDDYFGLFPDVRVAECYNNATGVFFLYGGDYVLKALSVAHVDCTVPNETVGFGTLKRMFR